MAGEMPSLNPPDDESVKTLYVGGLDARITEQDLKDQFYAHGEIESIRLVPQRACAFVSYTTREAAEKAAEELSNRLIVKGLRLKLMWGKPQVPKGDTEDSETAADQQPQGAISHGGMLPRSVISLQQSSDPLQPPQMPPPHRYFNIPAPPAAAAYPSMDPQRMGAVVASQEAGESKAQRASDGPAYPYLMAAPPPSGHQYGQYPQFYQPPYGYMAAPPAYQHHYPYPPAGQLPPAQVAAPQQAMTGAEVPGTSSQGQK